MLCLAAGCVLIGASGVLAGAAGLCARGDIGRLIGCTACFLPADGAMRFWLVVNRPMHPPVTQYTQCQDCMTWEQQEVEKVIGSNNARH